MATPPQKVPRKRLREIFNAPGFREALNLRSTHKVYSYDELAPDLLDEPEGTLSQVYDLYDGEGVLLATLHRYLKPDGTIGAFGLEDPYFLLVKGIPMYDP